MTLERRLLGPNVIEAEAEVEPLHCGWGQADVVLFFPGKDAIISLSSGTSTSTSTSVHLFHLHHPLLSHLSVIESEADEGRRWFGTLH